MDRVNYALEPNFDRSYCDYFYYIMAIYLVLGAICVADIVISGASNIKNLGDFMKANIGSKLRELLTIAVHFFVVKLLYSMCSNSLPAGNHFEGMVGGEEGGDPEIDDNL